MNDKHKCRCGSPETQRLREENAVMMEALVQVALICDSSYEATKAAVQAAIEKAKGVFE